MDNLVTNVAIDANGDLVGFNKEKNKDYHFAVHVLFLNDCVRKEESKTNSFCLFYETIRDAQNVKDDISSCFINNVKRVEICKVEKRDNVLAV